jgi:hypothetical protein
MRLFTRGLLDTAPLSMRKSKYVSWIGLLAILGTGVGLLLRAQMVVGVNPANAAIIKIERRPSEVERKIAAVESKPAPDQQRSEGDGAGRVRRTSLRSILAPVLPSPPLPLRVLPGPIPGSEHDAPEDQSRALRSPPVPSKIPPGPISESADNNSRAVDETMYSNPK